VRAGPAVDVLRQARWFDAERAQGYGKIIVLVSVCVIAALHVAFWRIGVDFLAFWSAARMTVEGHPPAAYDPALLKPLQAQVAPEKWAPFLNPPPFLLLIWPLGHLTYAAALAAWLLVTFGLYAWVLRGLPRGAYWPALAFPAGFFNALLGQNAFVTGGLLVGSILVLPSRPFIAGLLMGGLIIKPHLALLIPLALIAAGQWRAFAGAAVSSLGLVLLSLGLFGWETTSAFLGQGQFSQSLLAGSHDVLAKVQSVFAAARLLDLPLSAAIGLQGVTALGAALAVWRAWSSKADILFKGAVLAAATPLATPYVFEYDLITLVLPMVWLARRGQKDGFRPWEKAYLAMVFWLPALTRPAMDYAHVSLTPVVALSLLGVLLWRGGLWPGRSVPSPQAA
jgi:Glycosyltransferase family 87